MKTAFANSTDLEILGEIAGNRCREFYIRSSLALISRPFIYDDDKLYLYLHLSDDQIKLCLQMGENNNKKRQVTIDSTVASDKAGCARLSQKIEMLCTALTLKGPQNVER